MGYARTTTTISYTNDDGLEIELTAEDCAAILNAMARSKMLDVSVESIPAEAEDLWSDDCCALASGEDGEGGDDKVVLFVDCSSFSCLTPRKKAATKRKK